MRDAPPPPPPPPEKSQGCHMIPLISSLFQFDRVWFAPDQFLNLTKCGLLHSDTALLCVLVEMLDVLFALGGKRKMSGSIAWNNMMTK